MTTSAPRPSVRSRTQWTRSSGLAVSEMSSVSSAPRRLAASSRARGAPITKTRSASRELGEDRGVQTHRPASLDDDGVAHGDSGALHGVEPGRQAAAAPEKVVRVEPLGQRRDPHARQDLDALGPAAEQTLARGRRDPVDAPVRATRRRARHEAVPAGAARSVDVVEGHEDAVRYRAALDVLRVGLVGVEHAPDADVPGNDRVRHAGQPPVKEVHVGAADLARDGLEDRAAGPRLGRRDASLLERPVARS